ncbi:MAG TPA: helix-turn-helix transcriptional regulator [Gammaproteobacteria bacterium]
MLSRSTLIRLCRARDLLRDLSRPALRLEDVAREAAMSPFHFIRRFSAVFGETPHQFRTRARIERAKALLEAGASVTDVCVEVGFSSLGSFSDLFARRVGMSPSAYRRAAMGRLGPAAADRPVIGCLALMCGDAGLAIFEKHSRARRETLDPLLRG